MSGRLRKKAGAAVPLPAGPAPPLRAKKSPSFGLRAEPHFSPRPLAPSPDWQTDAYSRAVEGELLARDRAFAALTEPLEIDWWDETRFTLWPGEELSAAIARTGSFEPATAVALRRLMFPAACMIDAGANSGVFTMLGARWCGQVIAVEPSPRELAKLHHNIALNRFRNVTVIPGALGAAPGRVTFRVAAVPHAGHSTLAKTFGYGVPLGEEIDVEMTTIDALGAPADVIKIDVEGSEVDLLRGAWKTLRTYRPAIVIEVNPVSLEAYGASVAELEATLRQFGYGFADIDHQTGDLIQVESLADCKGENAIAMTS